MSGKETRRHILRYNSNLDADDTWRLIAAQDGIEAKIRVGGMCHLVEIALRWRRLVRGATFVAPADSDRTLWISQPVIVTPGLLAMELQLERAPEHASAVMSAW